MFGDLTINSGLFEDLFFQLMGGFPLMFRLHLKVSVHEAEVVSSFSNVGPPSFVLGSYFQVGGAGNAMLPWISFWCVCHLLQAFPCFMLLWPPPFMFT